jgi:A/G-specific adenine glycosylase
VPPSRARAIRRRLLAWWDAGHRDLPWRFPQGAADPYRVWIAEVMLQQTRVAVVVPYYRRFVRRFPTLRALARADEDAVLALWSGLGYYGRARRMLAAAREAEARHGGLPASVGALAALPGFGPYTAGAVASIAFALREPCVDGNVARVLSRLLLLEGRPGAGAVRAALWEAAAALVPARRPGDFNQALMELGATTCTRAAPGCARCPLAGDCGALRAGRQRAVPAPRVRPPPAVVDVACAVIRRGDEVLLVRRPGDGLFAGLWGLPFATGPSRAGARHALARVVEEATGLEVSPGPLVAATERTLTHRRLRMAAYECGPGRLPPRTPSVRWHPLGPARALPGRGSARAGGGTGAGRSAPEGQGMGTAMRVLIDALPVRRKTP